jgi:hypothetical protein
MPSDVSFFQGYCPDANDSAPLWTFGDSGPEIRPDFRLPARFRGKARKRFRFPIRTNRSVG